MRKKTIFVLFSFLFIFAALSGVIYNLWGSPVPPTIRVFNHLVEIPVIENKERNPDALFLQTMRNGCTLYQNDRDSLLSLDETSPLTIQTNRKAKLVDLKYDYLLYLYNGSKPAEEIRWKNPFYPTTEAPFELNGSDYITPFPENPLTPSSQTYLAYVYTATIVEGTKKSVYNFMISASYFQDESDVSDGT